MIFKVLPGKENSFKLEYSLKFRKFPTIRLDWTQNIVKTIALRVPDNLRLHGASFALNPACRGSERRKRNKLKRITVRNQAQNRIAHALGSGSGRRSRKWAWRAHAKNDRRCLLRPPCTSLSEWYHRFDRDVNFGNVG